MQRKKDAEKVKEDGGQEKEITRCKIGEAKEELIQYKIEKVKEELMQCKIDMAGVETEWYKKAAEECKKEKGIDKDKPVTNGGGGTDQNKPVTNGGSETDKDKPVTNGGGGTDKDKPATNGGGGTDKDKPVTNGGGGTDKDKPVTNGGGDENGEVSVITSREITPNHSERENCGAYANYYQANNKIGHQGFNTSDLLRELYPEMYSNPKIAKYIEKGTDGHYGAVNFKFAFTGNLDSAASFSNMKCGQCVSNPQESSCQDDKIKSFCYYDVYSRNTECNKNFFSKESCPDLIRQYGGISVINTKQASSFILVNNLGQMIDKEGDNTQIYYTLLKAYLKANGKIKDCGSDQKCKDHIPIMKKVAWDSDKEVLLKTVISDVQETNPYYYDNELS